jgi:predicted GIY-YIG superfamily endonuclease
MFENFVYVIKGVNSSNKIKYYIGYTTNIQRRIRQHNRELIGGAKATRGYKWEYCAIISNFRDNIEGLQIEWRLKYSTKKRNITDRFNSFFKYIDLHLNASPKNFPMLKKPILYININLLPKKQSLNKPNNIIIINTIFNDVIINHIYPNN